MGCLRREKERDFSFPRKVTCQREGGTGSESTVLHFGAPEKLKKKRGIIMYSLVGPIPQVLNNFFFFKWLIK